MNPLISCKELIDFLCDYVEGELADEPRREFDRHLAVCPSCVNYVETYKATVVMGKRAFRDPCDPPPDVPEELIAAILAARRKSG